MIVTYKLVLQALLESTLSLAQTHLTKGSAKQAEAYATQAYDLASELQADIWRAKASSMLAAIYIKTESLEQAAKYLGEAKAVLDRVSGAGDESVISNYLPLEIDELLRECGLRSLAEPASHEELSGGRGRRSVPIAPNDNRKHRSISGGSRACSQHVSYFLAESEEQRH